MFSTIFEKYTSVEFYAYPSSGSRVVRCGRTEETDMLHEANGLFSQFCEHIIKATVEMYNFVK